MLFFDTHKGEIPDANQRDTRPFYTYCGFLPDSTHTILPTLSHGNTPKVFLLSLIVLIWPDGFAQMRMGERLADKSAVGAVNRPLQSIRSRLVDCLPTTYTPLRRI